MRFPVGELLAESGELTLSGLRSASGWQREHGGTIERALLATGAVSEDALTAALSKATGVPATTRAQLLGAELDVVVALPRSARRRLRALPFGRNGARLQVAVYDPRNPVLETGLVASTGSEVELFVVADPILEDCLDHWEKVEADSPFSFEFELGEDQEEDGEGLEESRSADPFERLGRALLADALAADATELVIGLSRLKDTGYARSYHDTQPPIARKLPAAVVPPLVAWFRNGHEKTPFVVERAVGEAEVERIRVDFGEASASQLTLRFVPESAWGAAATGSPAAPPCRHVRSADLVFCPLCGEVL